MGSLIAAAWITNASASEDALMKRFEQMEKEMSALKAELATLKAEKSAATAAKPAATPMADVKKELDDIQDQINTLNKRTNKNNLKWGVDFRSSFDNLQYEMADGSKQKNDAILSNRLWLNMSYAANKNLSFIGQLAYNKLFGQRSMSPDPLAADGFDWVSSETAHDDTLRVRSAYFLYMDDQFAGLDIPWTFSIGRRPSTEGHLINYRDDTGVASPLAHTVNVEFDGASARFGMDELTGSTGSYFKLCLGRGMSDAEPRFDPTPYSSSHAKTNNIDMAGVILVPYDDKQYTTGLQYTYANNLIDITDSGMMTNTIPPAMFSMTPNYTFEPVGGLHTATAFAQVSGIGDGISDFLDDTTVFISGAMTKTDPYAGKTMLGSMDSETGYSYWIGTQFPSLISEKGRWGIEFNHGSKYWRPITYGEDTMIGSKIAARGDAYELYFTEPLIGDILSLQLRYTYIDYSYSGSNGFFGSASGTPMTMEQAAAFGAGGMIVDKAQDIRAYLRYKF